MKFQIFSNILGEVLPAVALLSGLGRRSIRHVLPSHAVRPPFSARRVAQEIVYVSLKVSSPFVPETVTVSGYLEEPTAIK